MKIRTTKNGLKIILVLWGRSNAYLIIKDKTVVLVDTGKTSAFRTLERNIQSLNLSIANISFLILTHTHFDHCQSARNIQVKSGCKIIVSGKATNSVKNGYTRLPGGTGFATKLASALGRLIGKRKFGYEPFLTDISVDDEYILKTNDFDLKILETAGHSSDSVSIIADNEIAIVGDAMFGVFKDNILPPFCNDVNMLIKSWGKILETDCRIFLPGHGKEISRELLQKEYFKRLNSPLHTA